MGGWVVGWLGWLVGFAGSGRHPPPTQGGAPLPTLSPSLIHVPPGWGVVRELVLTKIASSTNKNPSWPPRHPSRSGHLRTIVHRQIPPRCERASQSRGRGRRSRGHPPGAESAARGLFIAAHDEQQVLAVWLLERMQEWLRPLRHLRLRLVDANAVDLDDEVLLFQCILREGARALPVPLYHRGSSDL